MRAHARGRERERERERADFFFGPLDPFLAREDDPFFANRAVFINRAPFNRAFRRAEDNALAI